MPVEWRASAAECVIKTLRGIKVPDKEEHNCGPSELPDRYILLLDRAGENSRTILESFKVRAFLDDYFAMPVVFPNLTYGCRLVDNIKLFRNAIGLITPHGGAFANIGKRDTYS